MKEYVISSAGGRTRRVSLPDHEDVNEQLEAGDTAEPVDLAEPRPGSVLQI